MEPGEIHVWRARLDVGCEERQRLYRLLSADERARAARYRVAAPRQQFIVARGILRTLLGRYLDVPPERLIFTYSEHGKPCLARLPAPSYTRLPARLRFNLAHSKDLALYAFAEGSEVGVDVEFVHPPEDVTRLVEQFFSPAERRAFAALPAAQQVSAFFLGWTRKEAYLKARGGGLALPLDAFDVTLTPGVPAALLADRTTKGGAANVAPPSLALYDVEAGPEYVAALACAASPPPSLRYYTYPQDQPRILAS